jgi:hypothetical protein
VGDLLLDGVPEVVESGIAEPVHVEQKVVQVEALGPVRRTRTAVRDARLVGRWPVTLQRFGVVLVLGTVVGPPGRPGERRVEMPHRIVRRVLEG